MVSTLLLLLIHKKIDESTPPQTHSNSFITFTFMITTPSKDKDTHITDRVNDKYLNLSTVIVVGAPVRQQNPDTFQ